MGVRRETGNGLYFMRLRYSGLNQLHTNTVSASLQPPVSFVRHNVGKSVKLPKSLSPLALQVPESKKSQIGGCGLPENRCLWATKLLTPPLEYLSSPLLMN
jgi:hypothetical protein